jgi:phage tail-like protein
LTIGQACISAPNPVIVDAISATVSATTFARFSTAAGPAGVPAAALLLPFLSYWVGWDIDPILDLKQQRRLMRRAIELYTWHGTKRGLRLYLHLYTGLPLDEDIPDENAKHISITEPIGESFVVGEAIIGEAILGGGRAFHFAVQLRSDASYRIEEALVRKIIEQEKPAFCSYELLIVV